MMRCKAGDMVMVIGSNNPQDHSKHFGKVTQVVRISPLHSESWETEPGLLGYMGLPIVWHDSHLLPIRPSDEQDETLKWAGLPKVAV